MEKVKLTIFKAQHLPVRDKQLGSSDPYIKVKVSVDEKEEKYIKVGRTKTIKQTLDPEWNETFEFNLTSSFIVLELYDYDFMKEDDPMGKCRINVEQIFPNHLIWIPVTGVEKSNAAVLVSLSGHKNGWVSLPALDSWSSSPLINLIKIHPKIMVPLCHWKPKLVSDSMTLIGLLPEKPDPTSIDTGVAVRLIRWPKASASEVTRKYFEEYIREIKAEGSLSDRSFSLADGRKGSLRWQWIKGIIRATAAFRLSDDPDVGVIWVVATYSAVDPHTRQLDPDATILFQSLVGSLGAIRYIDLPQTILNIGDRWRMTLPPLCVADSHPRPGWVLTPYVTDDWDEECAYLKIECISQRTLLGDYLNKHSTQPEVSQASIIDRPREHLDLLHWSLESKEFFWALTIDEENIILIQTDRPSEKMLTLVPRLLGTVRSSAPNC